MYRNFKYIPTIKDKDVYLINQIFDYFYINYVDGIKLINIYQSKDENRKLGLKR